MNQIYDLSLSNIYLYICIGIGFLILITILLIVTSNKRKRRKIKEEFVEAEKIEYELNKEDKSETSNELESILQKMQEDIEVKPEDVVKKFEEEQEEKAIISYAELVNNVKAGKIEVIEDEESDINFVENLCIDEIEDVVEEPIQVLEEVEESVKVTPEMVKNAINDISTNCIKEEPKKFKQSEFISPIYGVMEDKLEYPKVKKTEAVMDIMNTRDYNKLTEEIQKQEEFLQALKEFRNNL